MVVVAGVMVLRAGTFVELKPAMLAMLAASRGEAGCRTYSYGVDVEDPEVIRVYEEWESREHFAAHVETAHFKEWRRRVGEVGIERRDIKAFEAGAEVPF
jgi:quinol monooxygenase YgiN